MNEFYVGYLPKAPPGLGRILFRVAAGLSGIAVAVSLMLVFGQQPFAASKFEFLQYRDYAGVIVDSPYPRLITAGGSFLLVAPGKHGASSLLRGFNLQAVQLSGALIQRGDDRMLELVPGSIRPGDRAGIEQQPVDLGEVTLRGEIVDSKCFFGVMNPGNGKVHRACAVRCLSGGIPPALLVKDASGASRTVLLAGVKASEILDFVAEPVAIHGRLTRSGDTVFLTASRPGNKPAITRN